MLYSMFVVWLTTAVGLGLTTLIIPGVKVKSTGTLLIAAAVLGLINVFIRPILWFLTAPLSLVTFGLFALVINAFMLKFAAALVSDFEVNSFGSAFLGALVMALIGFVGFVGLQLIMGGTVSWYSYEQYSQFTY